MKNFIYGDHAVGSLGQSWPSQKALRANNHDSATIIIAKFAAFAECAGPCSLAYKMEDVKEILDLSRLC